MGVLAYDKDTGRIVKSNDLQLTNTLLKAKQNKKPWEVVDMVVDAFKRIKPKQYKSYVVRLKAMREEEKRTWVGGKQFVGVSKDKENDAYLAHTVDFPVWIMMLLRKIYNRDELIMDKQFFRTFGDRYPEFRVMQSV